MEGLNSKLIAKLAGALPTGLFGSKIRARYLNPSKAVLISHTLLSFLLKSLSQTLQFYGCSIWKYLAGNYVLIFLILHVDIAWNTILKRSLGNGGF